MNNKKGINEVIKEYPLVSEFLSYNGVDCANCLVGTCRLENVLDVHNFSKNDQEEMYAYMDKLMNKETLELKKFIPNKQTTEFTKIISLLMEEHLYIKELLYVLDYIITKENFTVTYKQKIEEILTYIKIFADECHHSKEENILFNLFKDNDVVQLMLKEHDLGRSYRKTIISSDNSLEIKDAIVNLSRLLKDHIKKEDTILFPYLDKQLSNEQIEDINIYLSTQGKDLQNEVIHFLDCFNNEEFSF